MNATGITNKGSTMKEIEKPVRLVTNQEITKTAEKCGRKTGQAIMSAERIIEAAADQL